MCYLCLASPIFKPLPDQQTSNKLRAKFVKDQINFFEKEIKLNNSYCSNLAKKLENYREEQYDLAKKI